MVAIVAARMSLTDTKCFSDYDRQDDCGEAVRALGWERTSYIPQYGCPTIAPPGTQEKLNVFQLRLARGEKLFHVADARYEGDPRPVEWVMGKSKVGSV